MAVELRVVGSAHLIESSLRLHVVYMIGDIDIEKLKLTENRLMNDY